MEVLILSKTKYGNTQFCVGGICISDKKFVRLLNTTGHYQPHNTPFKIGDIWDISFTVSDNRREPHNEDVRISRYNFIRKVYSLETYLKNMGVPIWVGEINKIFDGKMIWAYSGKGYLSETIINYPNHSVGFWISDQDLIFSGGMYMYKNGNIRREISYKGDQIALEIIPKGKLIRLSLAKWWAPSDSNVEPRCYLQLSGWYDDEAEPNIVEEPIPLYRVEPKLDIVIQPLKTAQTAGIKTAPVIELDSEEDEPLIQGAPRPTYRPAIKQPQKPVITASAKAKNTSGSCYIATLCYGDYNADEVCTFRDFRDNSLNKIRTGRYFVKQYYRFAPKITEKLENRKILNSAIKFIILNPLLTIIKAFKFDK